MEDDATLRAVAGACPSDAELASFAFGGTAVGPDLAEHLATCPRCSVIVARGSLQQNTRASQPTVSLELPAGTMVGRYRIESCIGQGGMGVVYRALDTELERPIALKLVRPTEAQRLDELTERLRRESRLQARAAHPAVISVYDIGRDGDRVYVAMELAHGGTARRWLEARPRRWREVVDVFRRAGEGLAAAHASGLVHRDFKPDNVLVEEQAGGVSRVLVIDFGVARAVEAVEAFSDVVAERVDLTTTGALVGTPAYMAPEQLDARPVDARADEFAFAVSLWEALYGDRPYPCKSISELVTAMAAPLAAPRSRRTQDPIPSWVEQVLRRALAVDPDRRFQSMTELLRELEWRTRKRRKQIAIGIVAMAVVVAGIVAAVATRSDDVAIVSPCDNDPHAGSALHAAAEALRTTEPSARRWADAIEMIATTVPEKRRETCAASPPLANQTDRVRCLDTGAASIAVFAESLAHGDRRRLLRLVKQTIPPTTPYECLSDAAGNVTRSFPAEGLRPLVTELLVELAYARTLSRPGTLDEARRIVARVGAQARPLELLQTELTVAQQWTTEGGPKIERLRDIATEAQRHEQFRLAASEWLTLVDTWLSSTSQRPRAAELLSQIDTTLDQAGNPPTLRVHWHCYRAILAATESNEAVAAKEVAAAQQLMTSLHLPFDPDVYVLLGKAELRLGHADEALALDKRVYDFVAANGAPEQQEPTRLIYATALGSSGHPEEARDLLEPLVSHIPSTGVLALDKRNAIFVLAGTYNQLQRFDDTIRLLDKWGAAIDRDAGPKSVTAGLTRVHRATAEYSLKRYREAEHTSAQALEIYIELYGADHYDTADVRVLHGQVLLELGRVDEAREAIERGLNGIVAGSSDSDPLAIQGRIALADTLLRQGHSAEALPLIESSIEPFGKLGISPADLAGAQLLLAKALVAQHRDRTRARTLVATALAAWHAEPAKYKAEIAEAKALKRRLR